MSKVHFYQNPQIRSVLTKLSKGEHAQTTPVARFVGGVVRDFIIGKETKDIDVATTLLPEQVIEKLSPHYKIYKVGSSHGTIMVVVDQWCLDITTLREDVETDGRHAKVSFTDSWEKDASRRDFTINAIYMDLEGQIYDPVSGLEDLKNNKVRFIGDPQKRVSEDYLRILRFLRFSGRFAKKLEHKDWQICKENFDSLSKLSGERIWSELKKTIPCPAWMSKDLLSLINHLFSQSVEDEIYASLEEAVLGLSYYVKSAVQDTLDRNNLIDLMAKKLKLSRSEKKRMLNCFAPGKPKDNQAYRDRQILEGKEPSELPEFPIKGRDIIIADPSLSGRIIGDLIEEVRSWWFENNFPSEELCQSKLLELIKERSKSDS